MLLFFSGLIYLQVVAQSSEDWSMLFYTWMGIQAVSYVLALIGFVRMLMRQTDNLNELKKKSRPKTMLSRVALFSIIAGLTLTFPLLQTSLPTPIATASVMLGLVLLGLSVLAWIVSLVMPTEAQLEK
jgi:uncharacterized membrane protein (DUF485 family)